MAKRFALVPEEWLTQIKGNAAKQIIVPPPVATVSDEVESVSTGKPKDHTDDVISLLPRHLQDGGRILLHTVGTLFRLSPTNRILYGGRDDGGDEMIGSNIVDMLRYVLSSRTSNIARPFDASDFLELCRAGGVPQNVYGGRVASDEDDIEEKSSIVPQRWINLY